MTHGIIQRLYRTFVTPLDREDIFELARSLDDVVDAIDATAALVRLYQIELVPPDARILARIIMRSADQIVTALEALEKKVGVKVSMVEINRLENEADRAHQAAVRRLFEEERDPIAIINGRQSSTSSRRPPIAARTSQTSWKASSSRTPDRPRRKMADGRWQMADGKAYLLVHRDIRENMRPACRSAESIRPIRCRM